jgi:hypothetical protein
MAITKFTPDFVKFNMDLMNAAKNTFKQFDPIVDHIHPISIREFVFYKINHPGMPEDDVEIVLLFTYGNVTDPNTIQIDWKPIN